jgi:hypothetical protein
MLDATLKAQSRGLQSARASCRYTEGVNRGGTYLLTWTTHGTYLPGDPRGFVSRVPSEDGASIHNKVGTAYDRDMPALLRRARSTTVGEEVWISNEHAECCARAFEEASLNAHATIGVFAIMRGHCHVVVRSPTLEGAELLRRFKGVSARRLTQQFGKPKALSWWTRKGSHRLLTNTPSILGAIRYVLNQRQPLVAFRAPTLKIAPEVPDESTPFRAD